MFNIASEETYQDGQIIIKEGTSGDWVYVILSGTVEISKTVRGKEFVIELLQPNEVLASSVSWVALGGLPQPGPLVKPQSALLIENFWIGNSTNSLQSSGAFW